MNDWLQEWKSESWLKQRMGELFIWHREGSIGPRFIIKHCHNSWSYCLSSIPLVCCCWSLWYVFGILSIVTVCRSYIWYVAVEVFGMLDMWPHKQKHPVLHTSECTIVPRTVIFMLGTLVPNYICPKLQIKLCHYLLVGYVRNKYTEIFLFQITNMGESIFLG